MRKFSYLLFPETRILTRFLQMQTRRGSGQQEMGMWMLNMQFDADKGLV